MLSLPKRASVVILVITKALSPSPELLDWPKPFPSWPSTSGWSNAQALGQTTMEDNADGEDDDSNNNQMCSPVRKRRRQ